MRDYQIYKHDHCHCDRCDKGIKGYEKFRVEYVYPANEFKRCIENQQEKQSTQDENFDRSDVIFLTPLNLAREVTYDPYGRYKESSLDCCLILFQSLNFLRLELCSKIRSYICSICYVHYVACLVSEQLWVSIKLFFIDWLKLNLHHAEIVSDREFCRHLYLSTLFALRLLYFLLGI